MRFILFRYAGIIPYAHYTSRVGITLIRKSYTEWKYNINTWKIMKSYLYLYENILHNKAVYSSNFLLLYFIYRIASEYIASLKTVWMRIVLLSYIFNFLDAHLYYITPSWCYKKKEIRYTLKIVSNRCKRIEKKMPSLDKKREIFSIT